MLAYNYIHQYLNKEDLKANWKPEPGIEMEVVESDVAIQITFGGLPFVLQIDGNPIVIGKKDGKIKVFLQGQMTINEFLDLWKEKDEGV